MNSNLSVRYYYSVDEQGSTGFITDSAGNIKNEYWYNAFGNIFNSREEVHNRITYTGQQFYNTTQQYYLRARFYNPIIGRFTQEDVYRGDVFNLYAYCGNNPVRYWDSSGYIKQEYCEKKVNPHSTEGVGNSNELVKVYRGTSSTAEQMIHEETGQLMSDATRRAYMETGNLDEAYKASQLVHNKWQKIWGDENTFVQVHGEFGTELPQAFGLDRTLMSVTTDSAVAQRFAGQYGKVYEAFIPKSQLIPQTLSGAGESEYLIKFGAGGFK